MAEQDPERELADIKDRIAEARRQGEPERTQSAPPSKLGIAFRFVTELLAGVLVGGGVGWALDRVLGTSPVLLIVMFLFGVAAGILNVVRAAKQMNADEAAQRSGGGSG